MHERTELMNEKHHAQSSFNEIIKHTGRLSNLQVHNIAINVDISEIYTWLGVTHISFVESIYSCGRTNKKYSLISIYLLQKAVHKTSISAESLAIVLRKGEKIGIQVNWNGVAEALRQ